MPRKQTRFELQKLDARLVPTIIMVNVFDDDFSVNPPGAPIVDPTIQVGDTIRWVWSPGNLDFHSTKSVAGIPEVWDSDLFLPPHQFDHTFTHVGTFYYYCLL